jgi:hypothetical protein
MPMLLKSEDGKEFELAIIADRLPEAQDGSGDDEIPTVSFRVATEEQEWEETSPHLGSQELHGLLEWLESVGAGEPSDAEVDVLGSELNFQVVKDQGEHVHLRIRFHLEDRPEEFAVDADTSEARHVDLKLRREAVRMAAASLREDLEGFDGAAKDDLEGEEDPGMIAAPDADLAMIDGESEEPPGAGDGEDNAGRR